jgi:hypothetical protein
LGGVRRGWNVVLVGLVIMSAVASVLAAVCSLLVLNPRGYRYASRVQLRREWESYRGPKPELEAWQVIGLLADQLICAGDTSPIDTLAEDARTRGDWVCRSMTYLLVGLALLAGIAVILAVEGALR